MASRTGKVWVDSMMDDENECGGAVVVEKCVICALEDASCLCKQCGVAECQECFQAMHSHPSRSSHTMIPIDVVPGNEEMVVKTCTTVSAATGGDHVTMMEGRIQDYAAPSRGRGEEAENQDINIQKAQRAAAKRAEFLRRKSGGKSVIVSSAGIPSQMSRAASIPKAPVHRLHAEQSKLRIERMLAAVSSLCNLGDSEEARKLCLATAREGLADSETMLLCSDLLRSMGDASGADSLRERAIRRQLLQ